MKKQYLLMLMIIGLMITACKKDEDSPAPASSARVVTMQMKTMGGTFDASIEDGNYRYAINLYRPNQLIDTTITFNNVNDSTSFFTIFSVEDSGSLKLFVDGKLKLDTMLYDYNDVAFDFRYNYSFYIYP